MPGMPGKDEAMSVQSQKNPGYSVYICPRCGSEETACYLLDHRESFCSEFGHAEDWYVECVCSDCGKEFEIMDGYP